MAVVARVLHSPPPGPSAMRRTVRDALFVHWPLPPAMLRRFVPLPLDLYGGQAWITVTPYDVTDMRVRGLPRLPGLDAVARLDVRTYVRVDRKPGIWLLSSDATSPIVVLHGRWRYNQAFYHARTTLGRRDDTLFFHCIRQYPTAPRTQFAAHYMPIGSPSVTIPGSLDDFLLERYYAFSLTRRGEIMRSESNHRPWPVQQVSARIAMTNLLPNEIQLPPTPPLLHYCPSLEVHVWPAKRIGQQIPTEADSRRRRPSDIGHDRPEAR